MSGYVEAVRGGLIILKVPPLALRGARAEDAAPLQEHLTSALERGDVIVDLSIAEGGGDVSIGFRALMIGAKAALARDRALLLAAPTPFIREKLEIARFFHVLAIFATLDEAVEGYGAASLAKAMQGGPPSRALPSRFASKTS